MQGSFGEGKSFGAEVLGDLVAARRWHGGAEDGQVGRARLLKGPRCRSTETAAGLQLGGAQEEL